MATTLLEELDTLVRARYPLVYLVTSEESRAQDLIAQVARQRGKKLLEWSCTTGLIPAANGHGSPKQRHAPTRDPLAALDAIADHVDPTLFVLKDFHPFLSRGQFTIIRRLREVAQSLKNSHKTIFLLSPVQDVPVELEKELTVVNVALPDQGELGVLLENIISEIQDGGRCSVELDSTARERLLQAALGLTLGEAENVFARILVRSRRLDGEGVNDVLTEKQQIIRKSGLLEYFSPEERFDNVGGLGILKDWLEKRALALTPEARAFGLPQPRGVLMLGVQGCGKSLCAKAVASHWQLPLLRFDIGRMFGSLVGSSEENIRKAIAVAESVAPAILWVDEIDKAFAGIAGSAATDGGTGSRVLGTFLTWLSEKKAPVFVVATANDISNLPPELLRKGRLDEIFFIDLPSSEERADIFAIHLRKRNRPLESFNIPQLSDISQHFSGAEIEESINSALYDAFYAGRNLSHIDVLQAVRQTVPLATTMAEQIDGLRAWAKGRARPASGATA
ncbi:MAG TPA: AAA family ATPase [Verrucomicrobiae bacterium]